MTKRIVAFRNFANAQKTVKTYENCAGNVIYVSSFFTARAENIKEFHAKFKHTSVSHHVKCPWFLCNFNRSYESIKCNKTA